MMNYFTIQDGSMPHEHILEYNEDISNVHQCFLTLILVHACNFQHIQTRILQIAKYCHHCILALHVVDVLC